MIRTSHAGQTAHGSGLPATCCLKHVYQLKNTLKIRILVEQVLKEISRFTSLSLKDSFTIDILKIIACWVIYLCVSSADF